VGTPPSDASAPTRSRGRNFLLGCLAGCGGLALLAVSSCIGFIWWVNRPGELLEPARLRGPETTAYAEWTLRLEDPGTSAFVEELLASIRRLQERANSPLPGGLGRLLSGYQARRNETQLRQLFPCVVSWSVLSGSRPEDELHLVTVSIERLGNRTVVADWILSWVLGRDDETEVVSYGGENIYHLKRQGSAFFLRRGQIFFTTGIEAAQRAVDRLQPRSAPSAEATELDRLIDTLPPDRPLRGATTNEHGELERVLARLVDDDRAAELAAIPREIVRGATLSGGFDESSRFAAVLDVLTTRPPDGAGDRIRQLAEAIGASLSTESLPVHVEAVPREDGVRLVFEVDDLPRLLERWTEHVAERPEPN